MSTIQDLPHTNAHALFGILSTICTEIWRILDKNSYDFIYKEYDDLEIDLRNEPDSDEKLIQLKEEYFKAIKKMEEVFLILEKQIID